MIRQTILWAARQKWIEKQFRGRSFAKKAVSRFLAGEDLPAALDAAKKLSERGIAAVLSFLGENVESLEECDGVVEHYLGVLDEIHRRGMDCHVSIKPTHFGLDLDRQVALGNLQVLLTRAADLGNFVWIDMESSEYVDSTIELYRSIRSKNDNIGLCLQTYLRRSRSDLQALMALKPMIRLVKGAYNEPAEIAFDRKTDTDLQFLELAEVLLPANGQPPGPRFVAATHDVKLIRQIAAKAEEIGLRKDAFEVQMLYGIRTGDLYRLHQEGIPCRSFICYGEAWYPWFMRRIAERPANLIFVLKCLFSRQS